MTVAGQNEQHLYERLLDVAQSLFVERDMQRLCATVLEKAKELSCADGGTLYLMDRKRSDRLVFTIVHNDSLGLHLHGEDALNGFASVPLYDEQGTENLSNVASYVALKKSVVNIADAYRPSHQGNEDFDFSGTKAFDEKSQYRSQSFLCVPLLNETGQVVGVLQLINAKDTDSGEITTFSQDCVPVIEVLASFAALALDSRLIAQDQRDLLVELSAEESTPQLLERILEEVQHITRCDGGSLYLLEETEHGEILNFALVKNDSLGLNQGGTSGDIVNIAPLSLYDEDGKPNHRNVATYTALSKQLVNIQDAYQTDEFDFSGTKAFDKQTGYRSQSFLTVPLLNHADDVIGVIQLINAKNPQGKVVPFEARLEPLVGALASYAAIALNNQILLQDHKDLLDAFIKCIAQAIDAKSPHTSAHCQRIPLLMEMIAQAACEDEGTFKDFELDDEGWYELQVASWLHDCGKLATPDSVLDKSTKLHTLRDGIDAVESRFACLRKEAELRFYKQLATKPDQKEMLEENLEMELSELADKRDFIVRSNKGGEFMAVENQDRVKQIAAIQWQDVDGAMKPLLNEEEVYNLCIERGTLNTEERNIINRHMDVTIDMLESLPFPKKLRRVPEYAGGHHEKMDGTGFPKGLTRDQMSIPARMMGVADVFEALTSKDRPYKDPMKLSQALSILRNMRDNDHIDPDVYQLFLHARVWEKYGLQELNLDQLDVSDVAAYA